MNARNPKYNQDDSIDLELEHPTFGWIPFTASADDVSENGRLIHTKATAGEYGEVAPYVAPTE